MKGTFTVCFRNKGGLSEQEKAKIKEAILAASSLEEVERLQQQLQAGIILLRPKIDFLSRKNVIN